MFKEVFNILNLMDRYLMIRLSTTDILISHIRLLRRNTADG